MKCSECNFYWQEEGEPFPTCKANPDWPAPCEEELYEEELELFAEEDERKCCETCYNFDQDTTDKVACCNCCEHYNFYLPRG